MTNGDHERFCDLVMEGGITSGIVYPSAVVELSKYYRFHSIGGTSVGAIAAVLTAAAELRRRHGGPGARDGFDRLLDVPAKLGAQHDGRTKLVRLFVPEPATAPLFSAFLAFLSLRSAGSTGAAFAQVLAGFAVPAAVGALVILVPLYLTRPWPWPIWVALSALALVAAFVGALVGAYRCLTVDLVHNGYGLCKGYSHGADRRIPFESADEPLTLWLSRMINACAGREADGSPVTFGDLGNAPGFDLPWLVPAVRRGEKPSSIRLEMMATSLTHGRPFHFPLTHPGDRLFFIKEELAHYFPSNVLEHLVAKSKRYAPTPSDPPHLPDGLYQLPDAEDLPIAFAARLSLSFPILISAVPLWAIDYEPKRADRTFRRCWFSDGGITSNFPIHFFDSPLPLWPTFGIQLEPALKHRKNALFIPANNAQGRADPWDRFDELSSTGRRLFAFLASIFDAAQNWRDRTLARAPGVRDRVARVRLGERDGGLNLNMTGDQIVKLAGQGTDAAKELVQRFVHDAVPAGGTHPMGWDNHRWMRLRTLMAALEGSASGMARGLRSLPPGSKAWTALIDEALAVQDPDRHGLTAEAARKLTDVLEELGDLARELGEDPATAETAPPRIPGVRLVPDL